MLRENKLSHGDSPTKLLEDTQPCGNRTGISRMAEYSVGRYVTKYENIRMLFQCKFFSHDIGLQYLGPKLVIESSTQLEFPFRKFRRIKGLSDSEGRKV